MSVGGFTPYRQLGSYSWRKQVLTYSVLVEDKFGLFQSWVIESMRLGAYPLTNNSHVTPSPPSYDQVPDPTFFFFSPLSPHCMSYQLLRVQHSCSSTQSWGSVLPSIVETRDQNSQGCPLLFSNRNLGFLCA